MAKTCTTCGKKYKTCDLYSRQCGPCLAEAEAKAAKAAASYVPMAKRTCKHCGMLIPKRCAPYRLNSGAVERWCPLCVKWFGAKYEAQEVAEVEQ